MVWPPALVGISGTVFFCGMPTIAIGPVEDDTTPILISAWAAPSDSAPINNEPATCLSFMGVSSRKIAPNWDQAISA